MSKMKKMFKFSTKNKAADPSEWTKNDDKFQVALLAEDYEKAELLMIRKGVSPTKVNLQGLTTLHRAASEGKLAALQFLHEREVDLSTVDFHGQTPLHCAAKAGQLDIVRYLLQTAPQSLTSLDHNDLLPLHHACMGGSLEVARLLLGSGANIDAKDKVGRTSLFIAARLGNQILVKDLLDHHANINHRDLDKKTALMFATEYNHHSVVDYLVKRGANVLLTDSAGHNALWYADQTENEEIREILENAPSRASWSLDVVETRPKENDSPVPDSEDVVAMFVPEPEENSPPARPIPPSRKSKHAPPPPPPTQTSTKDALSPPPGFDSHTSKQLEKLEHGLVPMDQAPDDVDNIQVAKVSETFEMSEAKSNPILVENDDNLGRFSPEAVAAVEALILESNAPVNAEGGERKTSMDHVDAQAYKELEEENDCLNDEVQRVALEKKKLQEKVVQLERRLSESDQEGPPILSQSKNFMGSTIVESLEEELEDAREQLSLDKERILILEDEVKGLRKQVDIDSKPEAERNADDSWNDSDDDLFESEHDAKKKLPVSTIESALVASLRSRILSLEKELDETKESPKRVEEIPRLMQSESVTERDLETMNNFSGLQQAHDIECQQLQARIDELMDENFLIRKEMTSMNEEKPSNKTNIPLSKAYTDADLEELHQLVNAIGSKVNATSYHTHEAPGDIKIEGELERLQEYIELIKADQSTSDGSEESMGHVEVIQKKYERSLRDLAREREENQKLLEDQEKRNAELEEILSQVESLQEISQYSAELQQENDRLKVENENLLDAARTSPGGSDQKAMAKLTMQLQQENNDLKSENRSLKSQLNDIETSLKETISQREHANLQVNPLEEENMSLKLEIESLRRVVSKDTTEAYGSAPADQSELLSQISLLKKTISQQEETMFELMQQSTRDAQLREDYEKLQKESEVLNSTMADFQNIMASKGLETDQHVKKLEDTIASLREENAAMYESKSVAVQAIAGKPEVEHADHLTDLLEAKRLVEEDNMKLRDKIESLETEAVQRVHRLEQEKEELEDEKIILQRKLTEADENSKLYSVKCEAVQLENESFKHDKENLLKDVTRWQEEALQLQTEVSKAAADRISLQHIQDDFNALKEQNESLRRKLKSLEADAQADVSYFELKSKVKDLEEKLESEQNATVMAILDGRTEGQKNTEANLKDTIRELTSENDRLRQELNELDRLQQNGNSQENIERLAQVSLHASMPGSNGHLDNHRLGSSLKRRSEEMRLKEVEEENEKLKTELDKLRNAPHPMRITAANQHMLQLQEKFELMEKRHRDVVSTYRTHLLSAVQGRMDAEVSQALKNIIKIRMAPEVDV